jgi:hypothetical protein
MTELNASIGGIVAGDDLDITRTVTAVPAGQTLTKAWLTFQLTPGGTDGSALLQKVIAPGAVAGQGQITDDGADGTGGLLFQLSGADTLGLPIEYGVPYDIKVKTSAGKIYTVEQGKYVSSRRITQSTA